MNIEKILDEWAEKISKKASEKDTPLQESTDAFKAVTAYYSARKKSTKKSGDDEPDESGFSFDQASEVVNGGRNSQVRARRDS